MPDNLGMLFKRELVMFGPREVLLTSEEPVVKQFLNGRREGPIGMSEEKDAGQVAAELKALAESGGGVAMGDANPNGASAEGEVPPQIQPSPGLPERQAAKRRRQRVLDMMHTLPENAQNAIKKMMDEEDGGSGGSKDSSKSNGSGSDGYSEPTYSEDKQPTPSGRG